MTPQQDLIERRDASVERVLSRHVENIVVGDDEDAQFARDVLLSAYLGRFITSRQTEAPPALAVDSAQEAQAFEIPAPEPAAIPIVPLSPEPSVETIPDDPPPSGDAAPEDLPTGETLEMVEDEPLSPATSPEPEEAAPLAPAPLTEHPSYHAVLQIGLSRGSELLTGKAQAFNDFVAHVQANLQLPAGEARRLCNTALRAIKIEDTVQFTTEIVCGPDIKVREPKPYVADVNITYNSDEAEQMPLTTGKGGRPTGSSLRAQPIWWTEANARICPKCGHAIAPRYFASSKSWESPTMYRARASCGRVCGSDPMPPFRTDTDA